MRFVGATILLVALTGCGDSPSGERTTVISRQQFVEAVVELRREAYRYTDGNLRSGEHEEILARRGLTLDDLSAFLERHSRDVPRMAEIWAEIESRVNAILQERLGEQEQPGGI